MGLLESDVPTVYTSGRGVSNQADNATGLAWRYLNSLASATDDVKHPTVVAAIERYHATWQPKVNSVATNIEALGVNTSSSATVVAEGDNDASSRLGLQAQSTSLSGTQLLRPINGMS